MKIVSNSYFLVIKLKFKQLGTGSKNKNLIIIPSQKICILMVIKEKKLLNIVSISFYLYELVLKGE